MKIGIDLDGVIFDFQGWFHEAAQRVLRRELPHPDTSPHYDLSKAMGLTTEETRQIWAGFESYGHPDFFKGAYGFIRTAQQQIGGHELYFVTRPIWRGDYMSRRAEILRAHFGKVPLVTVTHTDKNAASVDVLVDDSPAEIEAFQGVRILFGRSYNQDCEAPIYARLESYEEVLTWLANMC